MTVLKKDSQNECELVQNPLYAPRCGGRKMRLISFTQFVNGRFCFVACLSRHSKSKCHSIRTINGDENEMLFPKDCPFAILVQEYAFKSFLVELKKRKQIDWAFLITNDQGSFARMAQRLPEHIPATQRVHLWRNYLDNFVINVDRDAP